jgi:hypothetical protein
MVISSDKRDVAGYEDATTYRQIAHQVCPWSDSNMVAQPYSSAWGEERRTEGTVDMTSMSDPAV